MQLTAVLRCKIKDLSKLNIPIDLAGNNLVKDVKNPFDTTKRCKMCGTGISYKNTQLISQFVSPYTENATGLCRAKYRELKAAYDVANKMLLIGPSKEPIYMTDPIGPANLGKIATHGREEQIATSIGLPDTKNLQSFQDLLRGEDPDALESTDVTKEQLLQDGTHRWLSGDQIGFLFAESEEFLDEDGLGDFVYAAEKFENAEKDNIIRDDGEEDFDDDWIKNITAEVDGENPPTDEK